MYNYIVVSRGLNSKGSNFKADLVKAINPVDAKNKFFKDNPARTIIKIFIYEGEVR